jgi:hypothetical protein
MSRSERKRKPEILRSYDEYIKHKDILVEESMDFKVTTYTMSDRVETPNLKYVFADDHAPLKTRKLISLVRNDVRKMTAGMTISTYKPETIEYFAYNAFLADLTSAGQAVRVLDIIEIDLNKAYWMEALRLKYLSPSVFFKILAERKTYRLRVLGSIATRKQVSVYEDGERVDIQDEVWNETCRRAYNHIRYNVGQMMREMAMAVGERFLFFWTDALFCIEHKGERGLVQGRVRDILEANGHDVKLKLIDAMVLTDLGDHILVEMHDPGGGIRPFQFSRDDARTFKNDAWQNI